MTKQLVCLVPQEKGIFQALIWPRALDRDLVPLIFYRFSVILVQNKRDSSLIPWVRCYQSVPNFVMTVWFRRAVHRRRFQFFFLVGGSKQTKHYSYLVLGCYCVLGMCHGHLKYISWTNVFPIKAFLHVPLFFHKL